MQLNEAAQALFADPRFGTAAQAHPLLVLRTSVAALGLPEGGTWPQIMARAVARGLAPAPLELGPHLRLQWPDQPEGFDGQPPSQHHAPPGSVTVVSLPLDDTHATPKGFYLRRISGVLWLRGYRSDGTHAWAAEDQLLFQRRADAA